MADAIFALDGDVVLQFPFNADELPNGGYDRLWDAVDFASFYNLFIGDGVYPNPSTNLQVRSLYNSMTLTVSPGTAMLKGCGYRQKIAVDITIEPAHPTLKRLDDILVRVDYINRCIVIIYRKGIAAGNPISAAPTRTDDMFELKLAEITINPGVTSITAANIKDTRQDKSVCGIVSQMVQSVDTTTLYEQYDTLLNEKIIEWIQRETKADEDFSRQLQEQQNDFIRFKNDVEAWRAALNIDVVYAVGFNFDNLATMKGTEKITTFPTGRMLETITVSGNGAKVAERELDFSTFTTTEKIYGEDGSILRQSTITKTFPNGSIKDVIV